MFKNKESKRVRRHYHTSHDEVLFNRLKLLIGLIIGIPIFMVIAFVFFGPQIGALFGFVSINRNLTERGDTIAPIPPIFDNAPTALNVESTTLSGRAEVGSTVILFVNGPVVGETITTTDGVFTFDNIQLIKGRNTIYAKATDAANNESDKSVVLEIQYDDKSPDITVISPKDDEVVKNLNKRVTITGEISEKATIRINERLVVQKPDLTFSYILGVEEGTNEVTIEATDIAGNKKEEKFEIVYSKDS